MIINKVLEGAAEESFVALEGSCTLGSGQAVNKGQEKQRPGGFLGSIHEHVNI